MNNTDTALIASRSSRGHVTFAYDIHLLWFHGEWHHRDVRLWLSITGRGVEWILFDRGVIFSIQFFRNLLFLLIIVPILVA